MSGGEYEKEVGRGIRMGDGERGVVIGVGEGGRLGWKAGTWMEGAKWSSGGGGGLGGEGWVEEIERGGGGIGREEGKGWWDEWWKEGTQNENQGLCDAHCKLQKPNRRPRGGRAQSPNSSGLRRLTRS